MNLDEFKELWQSHLNTELKLNLLSDEEISHMLQQRSQSALGKINRSIQLEIGLVILLCLIGGGWLYTRETELGWFEKLIVPVYLICSALFYWIKYKAINRRSITTENLKDSLSSIIKTVGVFMRIYFYTIVFIVPLLASGGILYGMAAGGEDTGRSISDLSTKWWAIIGAVMVVYSITAVWASRWYINTIYGVHYRELKICLEELEQE